jgi:hypothetical protein
VTRNSIWPVVVALVAVATTARAEPGERATATVERSAAGDTAIVRWTGVPDDAVEQEILLSLDGGRTWLEIARPSSIAERAIEVPLPRGVEADLRFAVRAGDEELELGEWETAPLRVAPAPSEERSLEVLASWSAPGDPRTDPGPGGNHLPRAAESRLEEGLERPEREASALRGVVIAPPGDRSAGPSARRSGSLAELTATPLSIPLRN